MERKRLSFTPDLAYLLALWLYNKHKKGVGVRGVLAPIFAKKALELGLTKEGKVTYDEEGIYFYNPKVKKAFERWAEEREHRIKYHNEFASAFLAGLYDSEGEGEKLRRLKAEDEKILSNLGFKVEFAKGYWVRPFKAFAKLIRPYSRRLEGKL